MHLSFAWRSGETASVALTQMQEAITHAPTPLMLGQANGPDRGGSPPDESTSGSGRRTAQVHINPLAAPFHSILTLLSIQQLTDQLTPTMPPRTQQP